MATEYELIRHGKMNRLNIFVNRILYRSNHMHSDFELVYVLDGEGSITTQRHTYALVPGNIVFLNSNEPHDITGYDFGVTLLLIQFSKNFLQEYFPELSNTIVEDGNARKNLPPERYASLRRTILEAGMEYLSGSAYFELTCLSLMATILRQLLSGLPKETISAEEYHRRDKQAQRMVRISSYLEQHYREPVRLADLAAEEGVTVTHLSHFISEHFGMTFQEYLNNIRFEHAVRIIGDRTLTLSDVSAESGFSELKYMTRMFETQLGMKPADFREQFAYLSPVTPGDVPDEASEGPRTLEYYLSEEDGLRAIMEARDR